MSHADMILVLTGTHEQPFDRLVRAADDYARVNSDSDVVIQYGAATAPVYARGINFVAREELANLMTSAHVVITHGGPGLMLEALHSGKMPITCPRDPTFNEHVDDHQIRFTKFMAAKGLTIELSNVADLGVAIHAAKDASAGDRSEERWRRIHENRVRLAERLDHWLN